MPATTNNTSRERLNDANLGKLPGHLGLEIVEVGDGKVVGRFKVREDLVAHTGFLLAGAVLSVADILCAYGVSTAWPEGASGFTTAEVKCNFVGTLREGEVLCTATMLHGGRTTQVWDARVEDAATGKLMAAFRCTQVILYPRA
ncbi:MAG: PaaI family thioesterase [Phenylobacterium sp.]|uniref:PaaI family thioesterase n=1 Tax=Phenylobacterium sp. TaxID=1871053 RepID=UPI0017C03D4F|nr:PaaI family thioesterase [Phenylobacterium sp.]MBA4793955.1 PaaI family thioesterase [Phenylobacterium sp.]